METIKVSNIDELQNAFYKYPGRTVELTAGACIDGNQMGKSRDWSTYRPVRKPLARAIAATITTEKDQMWNDFLNRGISHMTGILAEQKAELETSRQDALLIDRLKVVYDDPNTSQEDKDQARAHIEGLGGEV